MADEVLDGAPEGAAEVTDLRSTIMAAVEKQRAEPAADEPVTNDLVDGLEPDANDTGDKSETEAERNARLRDDKGRFAKGEEKPVEAKVEDPAAAPEIAQEKPADAPRPPPGWSPAAKVAFDKLPPEVQQAVVQREQEVNKGFEKLAAYKPIDQFMEMARQSGTTLDRALQNYVGMENKLRQDFPGGILDLCQRQGIHPVALANQILARNGIAPSEVQAGDTPPVHQQAPSVDPAIMQKITALESYIQQQQTQGVQTEIERFASDPKHTFFENVKADMGRLINAGYATDLSDAYDKACWANPEIRGLLIKQQNPVQDTSAKAAAAVQQAKAAARATGGAPSAGFKPNPGTDGASIRDTIRASIAAQRGA